MNPIQKLLQDQREEFEDNINKILVELIDITGLDHNREALKAFHDASYKLKRYFKTKHFTYQQQLIDVIIQEATDMRAEMPHVYSTQEAQDAIFDSYQNVITLLEEAKKNL